MAMIECPNCKEKISDKAVKCPHCDYELVPNDKKLVCIECGAEIKEGEKACPICGCPVDEEISITQRVEVTGVKISPKNKKLLIKVIIAAIAVVIVAVLILQIQKKTRIKDYSENLELTAITMLSGASDAETCGNLIEQVWRNAIYETRDSSTDKYTRPNGYFVSSFSTAVHNLFEDSSFSSKIRSIENNQDEVQALMKELKNPPREYEEAYDKISELYDAYTELTELVTSPSGSLQTFSSNFEEVDSEIVKCYKAMSIYFEEE